MAFGIVYKWHESIQPSTSLGAYIVSILGTNNTYWYQDIVVSSHHKIESTVVYQSHHNNYVTLKNTVI